MKFAISTKKGRLIADPKIDKRKFCPLGWAGMLKGLWPLRVPRYFPGHFRRINLEAAVGAGLLPQRGRGRGDGVGRARGEVGIDFLGRIATTNRTNFTNFLGVTNHENFIVIYLTSERADNTHLAS